MKIGLILGALVLFLGSVQARDPDVLPYDYEYGERTVVGGSQWSGGDTFICIALPVAVVLTLVLPHWFDGECRDWPVGKFENALSGHLSGHYVWIQRNLFLHNNIANVSVRGNETDFVGKSLQKFPTRSLCGSY